MRLLVDAHVFDGIFQGSRTYIKGLYREMVRQREDWDFYFLARDTKHLEEIFGTAPNVHYLKLRSGNKFKRLLLEIPGHIKRNKIDYAHFQYVAPLIKPCKFIVTIHDILFEDPGLRKHFSGSYRRRFRMLFKSGARQADILLTVSEYSRKMISSLYVNEDKKVHVVPNAVDVSGTPSAVAISEKYGCSKYLLYVSRIEPRKNHLGLLQAYLDLELDKKGYQLVFIGSKDEISETGLEPLVRAHKDRLEDRLHFFENIPTADLYAFYQQAELVVYPSFAEGFGIPPLEGAVFEKQVVCSSATAMAEFDFFRYHVDPEDIEVFRGAILKALADQDEDNLRQTARIVRERYNWKRSAQQLISIIENQ